MALRAYHVFVVYCVSFGASSNATTYIITLDVNLIAKPRPLHRPQQRIAEILAEQAVDVESH